MKKITAILCILCLVFSGCANTIPSRGNKAVPVHPTSLHPIRTAIIAFTDARPDSQKEKAKKISWPDWTGRIDYYSESLGSGLAAHMAEYLTNAHVFAIAQNMEFLQSDTSLKSLGYRAVLMGKITDFNASIEVPKWVLILAVAPIPLFGLTLVPIIVWPKRIGFDAVLDDLKLKDLATGEVYRLNKVEIHESNKRINFHVMPKWYLGELAEKATKQLIEDLRRQNIRF